MLIYHELIPPFVFFAPVRRKPGLPVSSQFFPDLYRGEGGLTTTYTPYEMGLTRVFCTMLNKLAANLIPATSLPRLGFYSFCCLALLYIWLLLSKAGLFKPGLPPTIVLGHQPNF